MDLVSRGKIDKLAYGTFSFYIGNPALSASVKNCCPLPKLLQHRLFTILHLHLCKFTCTTYITFFLTLQLMADKTNLAGFLFL